MKKRADILLFESGLAKSREKARALIMEGVVFCDGMRVEKSGDMLPEDAQFTIKEDTVPYVSRGGLKLAKALEVFPISAEGKTAADIGASTGGFTDVMLRSGAKKVYAIDVGYGQLDWSLRNDERVVVMERTNARNISSDWFAERLEFATMDVSFISVKLILTPLYPILAENAEVVVLCKPQFEAGRGKVGKNGVVREKKTHIEVFTETALFCHELGFNVIGLDYSPITGPKGNIEFLIGLRKEKQTMTADEIKLVIPEIVDRAHEAHGM